MNTENKPLISQENFSVTNYVKKTNQTKYIEKEIYNYGLRAVYVM